METGCNKVGTVNREDGDPPINLSAVVLVEERGVVMIRLDPMVPIRSRSLKVGRETKEGGVTSHVT